MTLPPAAVRIERRWLPWLVAVLSTAVALLVRMGIDPYLGSELPYLLFFVAVTVTACFTHTGATILAMLLGFVAALWFFVEPRQSLALGSLSSVLFTFLYFVVTGTVTLMSVVVVRSQNRAIESVAEVARRQVHLEAEIVERERAQQALLLQSHFVSELLDTSDKYAIFALLAARVRSAAAGALVTISEFNPEHSTLTLRAIECVPRDREQLAALLGRDPVGLEFALPADTRRGWIAGRLARVLGGIHELVFGQLPSEVCERVTDELGLGDMYAMACSYQEDILGTVAILTRSRDPLPNQELIESLIAQAGLALRRARSEEHLRRAEERLRLAQELSLDAFTILDAVRDERGTIVDFRWSFVNPIAGRILRHDPQELIGRQLLQILPGNKGQSDLFERYVRVVETGEPHDCEVTYEAEGIKGWFRNMAVRSGDGVAVSFSEISERKRAVAATIEVNERLREADRRKDEFIAVLSHELRNPLAAISSSLVLLERSEPQSHRFLRAKSVIGRQIGQLSRLVDDLLDVTRINRNKIELHPERLELNGLVRRAVDDYRTEFDRTGVVLCFEPSPEAVWVDADPIRLAQVVGNLLQNSAKFCRTDDCTKVAVSSDAARRDAIIHVTDTGAGIAPELLGSLFQPFMQADTSLSRSKGGLGLGLALVKGLVELHQGEVSATSSGLGQGAEFSVRLPLASPAPLSAAPVAAVEQPKVRKRVLIVDDNVDAADSLKELLSFENHEVEAAYSGLEALEKARRFRPDVLLCDIGLPDMDGYEVARTIRNDAELQSVLLVALSGYALPDDQRRAREAGFALHIAKPPRLEQLQALLSSAAG